KIVQSISLLAYLAETHDIWVPFLVVSPAATLHSWQQELTRSVAKLKALPPAVLWQYMILDEAQNIKNSSSARRKTLLGLQWRNRLPLTGTPIQNSMQ
ncbi:hypothetical protein FOMPIDRAFT_9179, partial [Fomitopsis schrenkii]